MHTNVRTAPHRTHAPRPNVCTQNGTNTTDWKVCNHWCGGVTEQNAKQFNAGKEIVLAQLMNVASNQGKVTKELPVAARCCLLLLLETTANADFVLTRHHPTNVATVAMIMSHRSYSAALDA